MAAWRRGFVRHHRLADRDLFELCARRRRLADRAFVFGYTLGWFPNGYAANPLLDPAWNWQYISSVLYHGTLPMLTLVVVLTGGFAVTMRNNMINLLGEDYIVMGRAKGLPDRRVMLWYAARNALLPTVSAFAISLGAVLGGSLVTEVVFNYPGMGNTLYQAILARDYPVIQGSRCHTRRHSSSIRPYSHALSGPINRPQPVAAQQSAHRRHHPRHSYPRGGLCAYVTECSPPAGGPTTSTSLSIGSATRLG